MTHSAAMAAEILTGKPFGSSQHRPRLRRYKHRYARTVLQIVYGRSQSAFSEDGLAVGAGLEDLGKGLRSQVGTMYSTRAKGPRYLEMAEGYVTKIALDKDDQIIGYSFVSLGKMMDFVKKVSPLTKHTKSVRLLRQIQSRRRRSQIHRPTSGITKEA